MRIGSQSTAADIFLQSMLDQNLHIYKDLKTTSVKQEMRFGRYSMVGDDLESISRFLLRAILPYMNLFAMLGGANVLSDSYCYCYCF